MSQPKNPHAVALGRKGGKAKVPKGFAKLTPEQRAEMGAKGGRKSRKKALPVADTGTASPSNPSA